MKREREIDDCFKQHIYTHSNSDVCMTTNHSIYSCGEELFHHGIAFTQSIFASKTVYVRYVCVAVIFLQREQKKREALKMVNAQRKWVSTFSFGFCLTCCTLVQLHWNFARNSCRRFFSLQKSHIYTTNIKANTDFDTFKGSDLHVSFEEIWADLVNCRSIDCLKLFLLIFIKLNKIFL